MKMSATASTGISDTQSRKRVRQRDYSPDMFLDLSDDDQSENPDTLLDQENTVDSKPSDSIIFMTKEEVNHTSCSSPKTSQPHCAHSLEPLPKKQQVPVKQADLNIAPAVEYFKTTCNLNSLQSTSNHNNYGLNTKMRIALCCVSQTVSTANYSSQTVSSQANPVVYTLNNKIPAQPEQNQSASNVGLSDYTWKTITHIRGIKKLYEWQKECLDGAIKTEKNLIYSLPTSGGKTLVAELLMIRDILSKRKDCLYVLPYVSIVQEKIRTLSPLAIALDFAVEEYAAEKGIYPPRKRKSKNVIYIATLEKSQGIINCLMELGRLSEIGMFFPLYNNWLLIFILNRIFLSGLVVVDEIHIIGEGKRGATLEILLSKLLLAPSSPRIVAMSATIGNIHELSQFLKVEFLE